MPIVQDGHPALRDVAKPVPDSDFGTTKLEALIERMATALDAEPDGVALAAPQIGERLRLFIVRYDRMLPPPPEGEPPLPPHVGVYINPEIIRSSRKKAIVDEGCLSVRGKYGKTNRHERTTVRARTVSGEVFERGGGGILAQAFQHEVDHLNGILFIDHATNVVETHRHDEA